MTTTFTTMIAQAGNEGALAFGFAAWFAGAMALVVSLRHFQPKAASK